MLVKIKSLGNGFDIALTISVAVATVLSSLACAVSTPSSNVNIARSNPRGFVATTQKQPFIQKRTWNRKVYYYGANAYDMSWSASEYKWYTLTLLERDKGIYKGYLKQDYSPRTMDTSSILTTPDGTEHRGIGDVRAPNRLLDATDWNKLFDKRIREELQAGANKELRGGESRILPSTTPKQYRGKWQGRDASVIEYGYKVHYGKPGDILRETEGRVQYFVATDTGLLQGTRVYEQVEEGKDTLLEESEFSFAPTGDAAKWLDRAVVAREANTLHYGYKVSNNVGASNLRSEK